MPTARAQVTIPTSSGEPADNASNTWYFQVPDFGAPVLAAIPAALQAFYEEVPMSGSQALNGVWTVKTYNVATPAPNYPLDETTFQLVRAVSSNWLPPQCSCVLSFFNTTNSSIPRSRRRGRVYLPWLATGYLTTAGEIATTYRDDVWAGLDAMDTALGGNGYHCIWSETQGAFAEIDEYRIDNSVDIIRRRKVSAGQVWTHPGPNV